MKQDIITLKIPLKVEDIRNLKTGDIVSISGTIWTCRSRFHTYFIEEGNIPPVDTTIHNVMIHSGPVVEGDKGNYKVRAISITSSIRFEKWEPEVIRRLNLRAIIGKGKLGKASMEAMKEVGCVHICRTGCLSGAYATMVKSVRDVHWLQLGKPEAIWVLDVENFGPLIVEIDAHGNCLYDEAERKIKERIPAVYSKLGIEGFKYAEK